MVIVSCEGTDPKRDFVAIQDLDSLSNLNPNELKFHQRNHANHGTPSTSHVVSLVQGRIKSER